ncbi:MAG: hypothetical protein OER95_13150 [Acidimicrobiia bacterium]|nr:hypothetical protein [Acidimicrobiia bacterium]
MTGSLSAEQVADFRRDGYLFPVTVMTESEAARQRTRIESFERQWRGNAGLPHPFNDYLRANLNVVSRAVSDLAHHTAILDAVESILGRRVALALRYITPNIAKNVGGTDYATTVRGVNRSNRLLSIAPPSGDFTAESLALFDEITQAQNEALSAGATQPIRYNT